MEQAAAQEKGYPAKAVESYRKALIAGAAKNDLWEAQIRTRMGELLIGLKKKEAIAQLAKAEALYTRHNDLASRIKTNTLLAVNFLENKEFRSALKRFDTLYVLQIKAGEAVQAGNTALMVSDLFMKKQDLYQAFNYADKAKDAYELVCNRDSLGSTYLKIAEIKRKQKKLNLAEYYVISKALPHFSAADNFKGRIRSFNFLGHMYRDQKRYPQAKWFFIQSNTQARSINDTSATISSLFNLSIVKAISGGASLAKRDLEEIRTLCRQSNYSHLSRQFEARYPTLLKKLGYITIPQTSKQTVKPETVVIDKKKPLTAGTSAPPVSEDVGNFSKL